MHPPRTRRGSRAWSSVLLALALMASSFALPAQAATPALKIKPGSAVEGSPVKLVITLSAKASRKVKAHWQTKDGTAIEPGDYTSSSGDVVIKPGRSKAVVSVPTMADTEAEADETFAVELSKPSGARIKTGMAVGTIADGDVPPSLAIGNATMTEGNAGTTEASFTVDLSVASPGEITVNYSTQDGTATSDGTASSGGNDYEAAGGTLTFVPDDTSEVANVTVNGDTTFEGEPNSTSETFSLKLTSPSGATLSAGTGTGTITNDDAQPTITIADVSAPEGSSAGATTAMSFDVSLARPSAQSVTVSYVSSTAGATNPASTFGVGADMAAVFGTLTFVPGDVTETVTVSVNQDVVVELNETFFINLSNPNNATIADNQGLGTIVNDD